MDWIMQNAASLLVGAAVLAAVVAILAGMLRAKRQGRSVGCGCSGDCKSCGACAHCQPPRRDTAQG